MKTMGGPSYPTPVEKPKEADPDEKAPVISEPAPVATPDTESK